MDRFQGRLPVSLGMGVLVVLVLMVGWALFTRGRRTAVEAAPASDVSLWWRQPTAAPTPASAPAMDRNQPVQVETATFALG